MSHNLYDTEQRNSSNVNGNLNKTGGWGT